MKRNDDTEIRNCLAMLDRSVAPPRKGDDLVGKGIILMAVSFVKDYTGLNAEESVNYIVNGLMSRCKKKNFNWDAVPEPFITIFVNAFDNREGKEYE